MAQDKIIKYILKNGPTEIPILCKALKINRSNISRACRQLEKYNEIKIKKVKKGCFIKYLISI